jgi:hypothetical protein
MSDIYLNSVKLVEKIEVHRRRYLNPYWSLGEDLRLNKITQTVHDA